MKYLRKIILEEIYKTVLKEQEFTEQTVLKLGDEGDQVVKLQQKLKDLGLLKFKEGTQMGYYGPFTKKAVEKYQNSKRLKVDGQAGKNTLRSLGLLSGGSPKESPGAAKKAGATAEKCPIPPGVTDAGQIERYQSTASSFMAQRIPPRTACEISFVKLRPEYAGKAFFVVDTADNLIYLFNQQGRYVDSSMIIDGTQAQSQNEDLIAKALMSADEFLEAEGIERKGNSYVNVKTGKDLGPHGYLNAVNKLGTRFWPKGIYTIADTDQTLYHDPEYAGKGDNVFTVSTLDGKALSNALHAFYTSDPKRGPWLENIRKKYGFRPGDPAVSTEYLKYVRENIGKVAGGNMSYGCINFPISFLKNARPYAKGAMVFVVGDQKDNYLVRNSQQFFNQASRTQNLDSLENFGQELTAAERTA